MSDKIKITGGAKVDYNDGKNSVDSFTHNYSHCGKSTGFGSAAFGIPDMGTSNSFAAGAAGPIASGVGSFTQGIVTVASGMGAMATGEKSQSSGRASFTGGKETQASGDYAVAMGKETQATAEAAFALGKGCQATGESSVALGQDVTADEAGSVVVGGPAGKPFKVSNGADLFTVDNQGTGEFLKDLKVTEKAEVGNTLKVGSTGSFGGVVTAPAFVTGGADYAEYFRWEDFNPDEEDRRYRFVTLNGDKIRLASAEDDFILGITSINPSIIADAGGGKYNNPEYSMVGLLGKLILEDDKTCKINRYCYPKENGIGTESPIRTSFRVMRRIDETHVQVLVLP